MKSQNMYSYSQQDVTPEVTWVVRLGWKVRQVATSMFNIAATFVVVLLAILYLTGTGGSSAPLVLPAAQLGSTSLIELPEDTDREVVINTFDEASGNAELTAATPVVSIQDYVIIKPVLLGNFSLNSARSEIGIHTQNFANAFFNLEGTEAQSVFTAEADWLIRAATETGSPYKTEATSAITVLVWSMDGSARFDLSEQGNAWIGKAISAMRSFNQPTLLLTLPNGFVGNAAQVAENLQNATIAYQMAQIAFREPDQLSLAEPTPMMYPGFSSSSDPYIFNQPASGPSNDPALPRFPTETDLLFPELGNLPAPDQAVDQPQVVVADASSRLQLVATYPPIFWAARLVYDTLLNQPTDVPAGIEWFGGGGWKVYEFRIGYFSVYVHQIMFVSQPGLLSPWNNDLPGFAKKQIWQTGKIGDEVWWRMLVMSFDPIPPVDTCLDPEGANCSTYKPGTYLEYTQWVIQKIQDLNSSK